MPDLLTTRQAAAVLRVSPRTMADWRHRGNCGPPFIRLSARAVRYRREDLLRWLAEREEPPARAGSLAAKLRGVANWMAEEDR